MLERVRCTHWDQLVFVDPSERIESRKERLLFRAVRRRWHGTAPIDGTRNQ
jgi:hypothetical protein